MRLDPDLLLGLNIGATIGIALYMSQAISVAFYIIAFTEAFEFLFSFELDRFDILLPRQVISLPATLGLALLNAELRNRDSFFVEFAIVFSAFTGMTAGVGLSGDLKNPSKSIPLGTTAATVVGMIIYMFVIYKLAASTISSALGSIMVAPRTLPALAAIIFMTLIYLYINYYHKNRKGLEAIFAKWIRNLYHLPTL